MKFLFVPILFYKIKDNGVSVVEMCVGYQEGGGTSEALLFSCFAVVAAPHFYCRIIFLSMAEGTVPSLSTRASMGSLPLKRFTLSMNISILWSTLGGRRFPSISIEMAGYLLSLAHGVNSPSITRPMRQAKGEIFTMPEYPSIMAVAATPLEMLISE